MDLHCVTRWSKLDAFWEGVSLDTMFAGLKTDADYSLVRSYGDYNTNLPLEDLMNEQAWIAFRFDDEDLAPEHGGPARLLVPHFYLWKSAKWVRGITVLYEDQPGFWENGALTAEQTAQIADSKRVIYEAFRGAGRQLGRSLTFPVKRHITEDTIPMEQTSHGHSAFRIEASEAKILIDPFLSDNPSWDKGWSGYLAGKSSTQGGD